MAQTSEAACLLQAGSAYPHRLGFRDESGEETFVGLRPEGFSVYVADAPIFHFDLDGRWQRAYLDDTHYLKGLDAMVRSVERPRVDGSLTIRRRTLSYAEASDVDDAVRASALDLIAGITSGHLTPLDPPEAARPIPIPDLLELLERVADWDAAAWFAHREKYAATYGPLPFLPPDLPNPVVLQKTLGHAGGRAFGGAEPAPHYVRSPEEFAEHAKAVRALNGRRIHPGKNIFLAGADVLRLPTEEILDALGTILATFPEGPVHAFLDDFAPGLPDREGWGRIAAGGLRKVTLGVESGLGGSDLAGLIASLKGSGIGVGLVVLVGTGGRSGAREHVEATVGLLGSFGLGRDDLITLVDRRSLEAASAESPDPDRLTDDETAEQVAEFRRRLSGGRGSNGPRVIPYNPDKRWA